MKTFVVILSVIVLSISEIYGQNFYATFHTGYGFGTAPREYINYTTTYNSNNNIYNSISKSVSFGEGYYLTCSFGYNINQILSVELALQYSSSASQDFGSNYYFYSSQYSIYSEEVSGHSYLANPSILISTSINDFKPYLKIGPIIGIADLTVNSNNNYNNTNSTQITETQTFLNGGVAFGYNAAIGVTYDVAQNIGLMLEINDRSLSYAPTKGELQKYTVDGVDKLPGLQVYDKQIEFKDNITSTSNTQPNYNNPQQQPKVQYPFSSVAISFGVKYSF